MIKIKLFHSHKAHILPAPEWPLEYSGCIHFDHLEAGTHISVVEVTSPGGAEFMVIEDILFGHKDRSQRILSYIPD